MAAHTVEFHEDLMVPALRAAAIAGISRQRLYYWEKTDLIRPTVHRQISERNIVRLYAFVRLFELVVAAEMVNQPGITLQHVRSVLARLEDLGYDAPLRQLNFAVDGDEIFFQDEQGAWEGSKRQSQYVIYQVLDLERIRARISRGTERDRDDVGRIERRRRVFGSKPVFAGTRVPVDAVQAYVARGAPDDEILRAFPGLDVEDLKAARQALGAA